MRDDWSRLAEEHGSVFATPDGAGEYRFLRGDEPFKYRFASRDDGLEALVLARRAAGRAALAAGRTFRSVNTSLGR